MALGNRLPNTCAEAAETDTYALVQKPEQQSQKGRQRLEEKYGLRTYCLLNHKRLVLSLV